MVANNSSSGTCPRDFHITPDESPIISAIMFAAGIIGNVAALVILEIRRRRNKRNGGMFHRSLFYILIKSLVITDLTGTCLITPIVQLSYARNLTLVGMSNQTRGTWNFCTHFGVSMTFFSLATMLLLFMTALERCFAIGYPYLYSRHASKKCAYIAILLVFLLCTVFCLPPIARFGEYVQYCPGTWCFINMSSDEPHKRAYAILYATVMLVLVLAIVVCNGFVMYQLCRMYQRRKRNGSVTATMRCNSERKVMSIAEEVEHLILLVFMTLIFIVCTLPLVVRVYINSAGQKSHIADLRALRIISLNSIFDPWVFILLSPAVQHFCRASVCRSPLVASRFSALKSQLAKEQSATNLQSQTTQCMERINSVRNV